MSNGNGWMPLYIGDYLRDTMELNAAEHGAYMLLLMYYWSNGPLPLEDAKLAQIARTELRVWRKTVGPIIRLYFTEREGRLHQKRADRELAKTADISAKRSAAARSRYHHPNGQDDNPDVHANAPDLHDVCSQFAEPLQPVCIPPLDPPSQSQSQPDKEVSKVSIYNYSLSSPESRAREAPSSSQSLSYDELHDVSTLTEIRKNREAFARDNAAAVVTGAGVRRVARTLSIGRPAEAQRSKWQQIAAVTDPAKPTTTSSYAAPARTPEQQLAELLGIPLDQAAARFGAAA